MCIIEYEPSPYTEDRRTTFLTWENGRYVPAPPMVNVPGLRDVFRKQKRQWERQAMIDGWVDYVDAPGMRPTAYPSGRVIGEVREAYLMGNMPYRVSVPGYGIPRAMLEQPTATAISETGENAVQADAVGCLPSTASNAPNGGPCSPESPIPAPDNPATTSPSISSASSQNENAGLKVFAARNYTENRATQTEGLNPEPQSITTPPEPCSSAVYNEYKTMWSPRRYREPNPRRAVLYGRYKTQRVTQQLPIPFTKTRKPTSILKDHNTRSEPSIQPKPRRKKSVSFAADHWTDGSAGEVKSQARSTSPPRRPLTPPLREDKASSSKGSRWNHKLTKENLVKVWGGGKCAGQRPSTSNDEDDDDDDTKSNTDWELADLMKERRPLQQLEKEVLHRPKSCDRRKGLP